MSIPSAEHPHEDLAVLALDALGAEEAELVEAHVRQCPSCQAELDDYRHTLAIVAEEGTEPPATAWAGIARQVAASSNGHSGPWAPPPSGPAARPSPAAPSPPGPQDAGPASPTSPEAPPADAAGEAADGSVVFLHGRTRGRSGARRMRPAAWLAVAAAAVAVVAGIGLTLRPSGNGSRHDVLAAAEALRDEAGTSVADLTDGNGQVVGQVVTDGQHGYAIVDDLDELPAGREYQLWGIDGDRATSLGMLGNGTRGAVAVRALGPGAAPDVAVSEEDEGGAESPTGPIVATGTYA